MVRFEGQRNLNQGQFDAKLIMGLNNTLITGLNPIWIYEKHLCGQLLMYFNPCSRGRFN